MDNKLITVTSPLLPDLDEFHELLKQIWDSKWITNNGQFHKQLEAALREYLGVPQVSLFTNGTLPLLTALQALRITGEVITTHIHLWLLPTPSGGQDVNLYSWILILAQAISTRRRLRQPSHLRPQLLCQCIAMASLVMCDESRR